MVDNRIKNIKLAKYWLVEAEKNGSTEAKKLLERIGESETNQKVNSHE